MSTPSDSWLCPACTFENIKSVVGCAMCGTKGPRWTCPQCTLENPLSVSFCNVCGGKAPPPAAPKPVVPKTKAQEEEDARLRRMMVSGIQFQMGMSALKDGSDEDSEAEPDSDEEIRMPKKLTQAEFDAKAAAGGAKPGPPPPPGGPAARDGSDEDSEADDSSDSSAFEEPQAQPHTSSPAQEARKVGEPPKPPAPGGGPPGPPRPASAPAPAPGPDGQLTGELPAKSRSGKVRKPRKPKLDKDGNPIPKKPKKSKLLKRRRAKQAGARAKAAEEQLAAEEAALAQQMSALFSKPEGEAKAEGGAAAPEAKREPAKPIQPLTFVFFGNSGCGKSFLIDELKENQKLFFKGLSSTAISRSRTNFHECDGMLDTEGRTGEFLEQITLKCQAPRTIPVLVIDHAFKFTDTFNSCLAGLSLALNLLANDYVLVINKIISNKKVAAPEESKQLKDKFIHISTQIGRAPTRTCLVRVNADFTQENIAGRYLPLQGATSFETLVTSTTDEDKKVNWISAQIVLNDALSANRSKNLDKFWPSTAVDEKWSGIPEEIRNAWTASDPPMAGFDKAPYNNIPVPPIIAEKIATMEPIAPKLEKRRLPNAPEREQEGRILFARLQLLHGNAPEPVRAPRVPKGPPKPPA